MTPSPPQLRLRASCHTCRHPHRASFPSNTPRSLGQLPLEGSEQTFAPMSTTGNGLFTNSSSSRPGASFYLWHQAVNVRSQHVKSHPWVPAQAGGVTETPNLGLWRSLLLSLSLKIWPRTLSGFTPGLCSGRPHLLGPISLRNRCAKGFGLQDLAHPGWL